MLLLSFYCYLVIFSQILIIKSTIIQYETSSNTSQFIDLENLIGSLHAYAPNNTHLIVRDTGLTSGQRKLLKRYENIQVILPTYIQTKTSQQIAVHHEFILINNTLSNRHNQGKYRFLDSIRKQFYLAIVIPFIESQLNQLIEQFNLTKFYPPCRKHSYSIDLIFYHNEKISSVLQSNISQLSYSMECFRTIHYLESNLSEQENIYPWGSAHMWKKLFINEQFNNIALRARGYTHFFLMEPDIRPVRAYWLDAIVEKITNGYDREAFISTNWWMIGSIYRGTIPMKNEFLHINGNALYHLSLDFIRFIENVSNEIPYVGGQSKGYDLDIFLYLFNHIGIAKNIWHKFQFSDFIQNCWHTGCNDTDTDFAHNNPTTYLIHGNKIEEKSESLFKKFFYIIAIGLLLFVFKRFRHYRRRFYCKRNVIMECSDICKRKIALR